MVPPPMTARFAIDFTAAAPPGTVVELDMRPYVMAGKCPHQDLIIYVDEVRVLSARLTQGARLRFTMPATRTDVVRLRLRCPGATAPDPISNSQDSRALGVSLSRLAALPAGGATVC